MANHLDLEEQEQLDQLKHFWNTWGTWITSAIIVVAGCVATWNGYQYWQSRQATQAAALFDSDDSAVRSGDQGRMVQAFGDLKSGYAATTQTSQAGLAIAKAMADAANIDGARDALAWVANHSGDEGLKAIAKVRLAGVLMEEKKFDEALKQLSGSYPPEFEAVFADRRGDIFRMQDKRADAIAEYKKAYKAFDEGVEYRRLVEIKLGALGVSSSNIAMAALSIAPGAK